MIEKLENPFIDEVRIKPNEFIMTENGVNKIIEISRALDNEVQNGTIANRAAMQIFVNKLNEVIDAVKPKYGKIACWTNSFSNNYSVLTSAVSYGVSAVACTGGFSGLLVPAGVTKVRIRATGLTMWQIVGNDWGKTTENLVINGVLKPIRSYPTVAWNQNGDYTVNNLNEDAIYNVTAGDVFGLKLTKSGPSGIQEKSVTLEMEVIE